MLIGIDGNEANIEKRVGVNQYGYELLWAIYRLQDEWKKGLKFVIYLKNHPRSDLPPEGIFWKYKTVPGEGLWIITKLMPLLFKDIDRPDLFFSPSHYVPPFAPQPRVCSIMDLGYLEFSGQFKKYDFWQLTLWSAWSILVSKGIIAISENTKDDIVRHYPFASKKIYVTPLAYDKSLFNLNVPHDDVRRVRQTYGTSDNYILFISTLKPNKNVEGLIEAYAAIADQIDENLVIAGKKGWLYGSIFTKVKQLNMENRVIFTDFVTEEDKPGLIAGAKLFALPSYWEGFGLDVLSAMACGVPVLVSDQGSLPEVVGGAGIIVDPYHVQEISRGLLKVLKMNQKEYNELAEKGLTRVKDFSWEKTAQKTLEVLTKLTEK